VLFGCYLFVTSDPESWPLGPKPFVEIFGDPLVFQHKVLALIPVVIGLVDGLTGTGLLRSGRARYLVPSLAVLGGVSLFVHFHGDTFHLDAIYVQHAAMGLTAAGLGVTLLVARWSRRAPAVLAWAWPVFLVGLGLILFFYTER
jgi:putative copper resistance protein D